MRTSVVRREYEDRRRTAVRVAAAFAASAVVLPYPDPSGGASADVTIGPIPP